MTATDHHALRVNVNTRDRSLRTWRTSEMLTEDLTLKEELSNFVRQGLQRQEMLSFLARDFPLYAWSIRTLDRRLHHLDIYYSDTNVTGDPTSRNETAEYTLKS